ncbi:MAG: MBL fold metallo-hydrolase, partial [Candidatus Wallbacteria bacterium]|nr:MBL fold metallo-hydrolase [Candidatus Wallbacteria bacterium]
SYKLQGFEFEHPSDSLFVTHAANSCNIGVLTHKGSALVIDSGRTPFDSASLAGFITTDLGLKIAALFNTHNHADHTFGNQSFKCPVISSESCLRTMEKNLTTYWTFDQITRMVKETPSLAPKWKNLDISFPTVTFKDEMLFDLNGLSVHFIHLGGHTACSSIAFDPVHKILFSGDLVLGDRYPYLDEDGDPGIFLEALKRIVSFDPVLIVPGHGKCCDIAMVKKMIEYYTCLQGECRRFVDTHLSIDKVQEVLVNCCGITGIPRDHRRHRINIASVLAHLRKRQD